MLFQLLQYISDSGGVLGLWFGFAIMTFIEFFEFFVDLIVLTSSKISTACGGPRSRRRISASAQFFVPPEIR